MARDQAVDDLSEPISETATFMKVGGMAARRIRLAILVISAQLGALPPAAAAEEYLTGSPGLVCETPGQLAETLGSVAGGDKRTLRLPNGCRLVEYGSPVRIVSRDHAVAKVAVGPGPNPVLGYMPLRSITNTKGDPID